MTMSDKLSFSDRFYNLYISQDLYGASLCNPLIHSNKFFNKKSEQAQPTLAKVAFKVGKFICAFGLGLLASLGIMIKLCHAPFLNREVEIKINDTMEDAKRTVATDIDGGSKSISECGGRGDLKSEFRIQYKFNSLKDLTNIDAFVKKATWQYFRKIEAISNEILYRKSDQELRVTIALRSSNRGLANTILTEQDRAALPV